MVRHDSLPPEGLDLSATAGVVSVSAEPSTCCRCADCDGGKHIHCKWGAAAQIVYRYERRGVKVINLPKSDRSYDDILACAFRELREYWADELPLISTSDPEPQVDLSLPALAQGRLAFFAVPTHLAAYYKSFAYPMAERLGFTPIMAVDVIAPGDNFIAKIQALIEKCAVMVVDLDSPNTVLEASLALSDNRLKDRLILIASDIRDVPGPLRHLAIIIRPYSYDAEDQQAKYAAFSEQLQRRLSRAFREISPVLSDEPARLVNKGEYRAAVLASFSLLEHELRIALQSGAYEHTPGMGIGIMLKRCRDRLPSEVYDQLLGGLRIRNGVAHTAQSVSEDLARQVVNDVNAAIEILRRNN